MIHLDKYLADMGIGTRQEVKRYIRQGRVSIDGNPAKSPETKIEEKARKITFDGREVDYADYEYYMLNKPSGVVSATEDARCTTVVDLIRDKKRKDLFPVGRLDKDTEGLLSPRKHVDKTYYAQVAGRVTKEDAEAFREGVNIGTEEKEEWTRPGVLEILKSEEVSEIRLTIQEGKYHQVKRMFQAVGKEVLYLRRESMGSLKLDETLKPGEYRPLTKKELEDVADENA